MLGDEVDREGLAQAIREANRPVHLNELGRIAARTWLETAPTERRYAPGATYSPGETVSVDGQPATVVAARTGGNPAQGTFQVLTLRWPDGSERHLAAAVPDAPTEDREPVTEHRVRALLDGGEGPSVRAAIQEALGGDTRFGWFQDAQGDHWCLVELLPPVSDDDLATVWRLLQDQSDGEALRLTSTDELVVAICGQKNDGTNAYLLTAFALNVELARCSDVRWLGQGWALEDSWQRLQDRPALIGPRQPNVVTLPDGVSPSAPAEDDDGATLAGTQDAGDGVPSAPEPDIETWRLDRASNATFTLVARHYYGGWLPLTRQLRRVLPPSATGTYQITVHHRFDGSAGSFTAWVDRERDRILGSAAMYEAFREHRIYPGARLVLSHRGNLWGYDIRTKPVSEGRRVKVRRLFLSEEGHLEYEELDEPVRYEIDPDVFVADVRWEDIPALFRQADEVGTAIFQLMYQRCCQWWEEGGRGPLYVTAEQLFEAVHFNDEGRPASKTTIVWELWRRLAFEAAGSGRYRFHPEHGDRQRSIEPSRHRPRAITPIPSSPARTRRLLASSTPSGATELPDSRLVQSVELQAGGGAAVQPRFERTRTSQLVAADLVSAGPLFEVSRSDDPRPQRSGTESVLDPDSTNTSDAGVAGPTGAKPSDASKVVRQSRSETTAPAVRRDAPTQHADTNAVRAGLAHLVAAHRYPASIYEIRVALAFLNPDVHYTRALRRSLPGLASLQTDSALPIRSILSELGLRPWQDPAASVLPLLRERDAPIALRQSRGDIDIALLYQEECRKFPALTSEQERVLGQWIADARWVRSAQAVARNRATPLLHEVEHRLRQHWRYLPIIEPSARSYNTALVALTNIGFSLYSHVGVGAVATEVGLDEEACRAELDEFSALCRIAPLPLLIHLAKAEGSSKTPFCDDTSTVDRASRAIEARGIAAVRALVRHNLLWGLQVAREYGRLLEPMDLIQEANVGLMTAAHKFDYRRGHRFTTYATWWIRQAISRSISDKGSIIRLPVHIHDQVYPLLREIHHWNADIQDCIELLVDGGLDRSVAWMAARARSTCSFEAVSGSGELMIEDDDAGSEFEYLEYHELIRQALDELQPRDRLVILLRFGLENNSVHTLEQIGERLGLTRERIRQIEDRAMKALRRSRSLMRTFEGVRTMGEGPPPMVKQSLDSDRGLVVNAAAGESEGVALREMALEFGPASSFGEMSSIGEWTGRA